MQRQQGPDAGAGEELDAAEIEHPLGGIEFLRSREEFFADGFRQLITADVAVFERDHEGAWFSPAIKMLVIRLAHENTPPKACIFGVILPPTSLTGRRGKTT